MAANTVKLFDGAFSGFMAVMAGSQSLDTTAADYATLTAAANAFATQVDARIGVVNGGVATTEQELLLSQICAGVMNGRPGAVNSTAAFYDAIAQAVNAIWANTNGKLQ